jgi:8-amino-7-oxononanoate synthase
VFQERLIRLKAAGLLRERNDREGPQARHLRMEGRELLNFASNDYLGLAADPRLKEAARRALQREGTGGGAARLLGGGSTLQRELETAAAALKGAPDALLLGSGFQANTGILPALAGRGDVILSDELNHASIVDGTRLARAMTYRYRHRSMEHLEKLLGKVAVSGKRIVATDTVFSMDGTVAPLRDILSLCERYDALLYLDDAHGTGVLGGGRGALSHAGLAPGGSVIQMGTFSKALGSYGAFAAAEGAAIEWLVQAARSFVYSTALPPAVVAASLEAVRIVSREPVPEVERLWRNRALLHRGLGELGLDTGRSETPILPVFPGDVERTLRVARGLRERGIYAPAIRPPTVPTPRIRLSVTAAHGEEDVDRLLRALKDVLASL